MVGDYVTLDQLDMQLSLLPAEETNLWGVKSAECESGKHT
jgi:hypothetical protein